jgi:hypothetical protein
MSLITPANIMNMWNQLGKPVDRSNEPVCPECGSHINVFFYGAIVCSNRHILEYRKIDGKYKLVHTGKMLGK